MRDDGEKRLPDGLDEDPWKGRRGLWDDHERSVALIRGEGKCCAFGMFLKNLARGFHVRILELSNR